jgi:glycosidase
MGVMLQAFYWDCPKAENREHQWWAYIKSKLPTIAQAGFTALWLPPANKAAGWKSMGYDPYDYYDLGEFDQKGGAPTWFGSKAELLDLSSLLTRSDCKIFADREANGPGECHSYQEWSEVKRLAVRNLDDEVQLFLSFVQSNMNVTFPIWPELR